MIIQTLSVLLFLVFALLSGFHFYWLSGGTYGVEKVIPTKGDGPNEVAIPKMATLVVALVLLSFGLTYLINLGIANVALPDWAAYGYWFIPSIFILRSIGDFNYVGFFKRIKHTEFAKADSKLFSPLCLAIGVIGMLVQLLK